MERVGSDVARELRRFGPVAGLEPLLEAWANAVGPEIARNAWPARRGRDGTLHVHARSAAWAFELAQLEPRIREALGDIAPTRLRFAVGPLPEPSLPSPTASREKLLEPSEEHVRRGADLTAEINDESLRKVVAKTVALSLAKAQSDRSFW
jgi:hypothetical protein